ncbi:MAG TPA: hypothetical protein VFQ91_07400 [Bryobacteraceae bacterium]|nr:hypothetical protein [Bryobacteraceae bacterium]
MKYPILLLAAASLWSAEEATRTIQKSFPLSGAQRSVFVCGINGGIRVSADGGNEVRFSIDEKLEAPSREVLDILKREVDVVFTHEGGAVRAGVKGPWSDRDCSSRDQGGRREGRRWEGRDTRIVHKFNVSVPRDAAIEIRTVNGGIEITGTSGPYKVNTVNGSIHLSDVENAGEVNTVNGTVQAVYRANPSNDTKFRTVNGKLDLYFQPSLNADFQMKTVNGKAFTDFDMTSIPTAASTESGSAGMKVIHRRGTLGQLRAGNGGPRISTETVNGSILIHSLAKGRP